MSLPRPNESYHFQANLIWLDSPFKSRIHPWSLKSLKLSLDSKRVFAEFQFWITVQVK